MSVRVQYILDSVIEALVDNPERCFIYVEIAFFWRWWNEQSNDTRNIVKKLVNDGAKFLRDQVGDCARPKIAWQIDPFGHSREAASLFAQMGFDGVFFARLDYQDEDRRNQTKTMEFVWKGSVNLDRRSWLFTSILSNFYDPPDTFCFDQSCQDPPIMDDPRLHDYNVPERVQGFINAAHDQAKGFVTNHNIMTMGRDFQYENAHTWFTNLDKLMKYVNAQVFIQWTSKTDDFFPYGDTPHGFWTGFFTSRLAFKRYERYANNILQVTRQLNAFSQINLRHSIFDLNEAMGIAQHHDAISATEKQHVADDYAQRLSKGIDKSANVINNAYAKLLPKKSQLPMAAPQFRCQYLNISECLPIEGQNRFTSTLRNPTIHPVTYHVRVPVTKEYLIRDPMGNVVPAEYRPISNMTQNIPARESSARNQYIFTVALSALGFSTYYFEIKKVSEKIERKNVTKVPKEMCYLKNENLRVEFDDQGNLHQIINLKKNISVSFAAQGFYWYTSFPGNNSAIEFQASGAYVFRPLTSEVQPVSTTRTITCTKTKTVQSALIVFNEWVSQEVNLYQEMSSVEVEWTVGPIPIDDNVGKEIIVRYDTDIDSASKYSTDANGREVLERIRNYRPTWNYSIVENVSDRSQGGGSIHDDSLGVDEPLNETAFGKGLVVRGRHLLIVESPANSGLAHRVAAQQLFMSPIITFASSQISYANYSNQTYSQPVRIDLQTLFKSLGTITGVIELALGANLPLSQLQRLSWMTNNNESSHIDMSKSSFLKDTIVMLNPMEIKTFQVTLS
ncbi:unnamed protein product [Adineta ricciae]|uniref:Alpha-mannosidase n=1 Tax=Adineta ricciae TaxID=249248 RepID=A0A815CMA2_ADIRI|nr:unnamed protein product [Adineta ricciae]